MVGTTKYSKGAAPILSIVESSDTGALLKLQFYKYNFSDKIGWNSYQEYYQHNSTYRLGFISKFYLHNMVSDFNVIQLPLAPATSSKLNQRKETIQILADVKAKLNTLGKLQHILVSSNTLPVNAGLIIGYALHQRQNIQLSYVDGEKTYSHTKGEKIIQFEETIQNHTISPDKPLSLCIYIQAKFSDHGASAFYEYIKNKGLSNVFIVSLVNHETYDESFDLELSAKSLNDTMIKHYEYLKNSGYTNIRVHLFYNGFWGLALLLGNQLATTFPICLYDFNAADQRYYTSFTLRPGIFNL